MGNLKHPGLFSYYFLYYQPFKHPLICWCWRLDATESYANSRAPRAGAPTELLASRRHGQSLFSLFSEKRLKTFATVGAPAPALGALEFSFVFRSV